jgi:hypothetical protein
MKKSDSKKGSKDSGPVEASKKPGKVATSNASGKSGGFTKSMDLKDVECYHCHKKGHYANKCLDIKAKDTKGAFKVRKAEEEKASEPTLRQLRIRYSDLNSSEEDSFIRHWILVLDLDEERMGWTDDGNLVRVFVDTGANINTISRRYLDQLRDLNVKLEMIPGPIDGITIQLVGGRTLQVSGDKVRLQTRVATNMGRINSIQEFLVLQDDSEDLVMGVNWHRELMGGVRAATTRLIDMPTVNISLPNPLGSGHDEAPEDQLLEESSLDAYPRSNDEEWQNCHFNPEFPQLDRLKDIVRDHGAVLFRPFDKEGLRVDPLKLQVRDTATFKMQPCRFIRPGILEPFKALIDLFVAEGVLIPDSSCEYASPLVVVHKKMVAFEWQ